MCKCLGMVIFAFFLVTFTLPGWFFARILLTIECCFPSYKARTNYYSKVFIGWMWWLAIKFCCCILRIHVEGLDEMNKSMMEKDGQPRLLMMNHTSFMDALWVASAFKSSIAGNMKAFAAGHLFKMPFLGGISYAAGHFPIPFKDSGAKPPPKPKQDAPPADGAMQPQGSAADFSVDKDAVAKVQEEFNDWVKTGHIGAWFPEGRLNPHPNTMQQFRAGGCKVAAQVDCQIWCVCLAGFEVFWHRKAPVGGAPANCKIKCFKLADSSFDLLKQLSSGESVDEKQKSLLLANHAQAKFQETRDTLNADPWVSLLPSAPAGSDAGTALVDQKA